MKAAVFYGKHDIRVEEVQMPEPGDTEVLIKVMACGVCGTDVHIYEGDKGAAATAPPTILGHEFAGVVEKVGAGVRDICVGDRVCIDPNRYCGKCSYCKDGLVHYCEHMTGYGTTVSGGFAQYCSVEESQIYRLPDNISYEQGAMTEPVACCLHGIDMCGIQPGDCVVIIGGGMIGQIMLQLARISGAARVALIEPVEDKRKTAKKLGADLCLDPAAGNIGEQLSANGVKRVTQVIECVGKTGTIRQAIEIAGKKSTVMMFGLTKPDEELSIKPFEIFEKEITLKASYINPQTQQRALDLISTGRIDVKSMVCGVEGLSGLENILSDSRLRAGGKYVINPWI